MQSSTVKKTVRSNYKVQRPEEEDSENEQETSVHTARELNPNPWNPSTELKFPCPMLGQKHRLVNARNFFI